MPVATRRPPAGKKVAPPPTRPVIRGHVAGRIVGVEAGRWLVDYPGNPHGPLPARTTLQPDAGALRRAALGGAEALLVFEGEHSHAPVVVGLLAPPVEPPGADSVAGSGVLEAEAVVDGERVVCTARHELVLRCGRASIHLLSDGTVRIRGTNVLSRASATNRIRGADVQIN